MSKKPPQRHEHTPFAFTSGEELQSGLGDLSDLYDRTVEPATETSDEIPVGTFDESAPVAESNETTVFVEPDKESGKSEHLSFKERMARDPAASVVMAASYLRQAYFVQAIEQGKEEGKNPRERRADADERLARMFTESDVVDGGPELMRLIEELRTEKRGLKRSEERFLDYINSEEKYYKAVAGVKFKGPGGLYDDGKGNESYDAARQKIEAVKAELQTKLDGVTTDNERKKLEGDIEALTYYEQRIDQDSILSDENWRVSEFLEVHKDRKSPEARKRAKAADRALGEHAWQYRASARALRLLAANDEGLAKPENTMKPKRDPELNYVAVLDQPLDAKSAKPADSPKPVAGPTPLDMSAQSPADTQTTEPQPVVTDVPAASVEDSEPDDTDAQNDSEYELIDNDMDVDEDDAAEAVVDDGKAERSPQPEEGKILDAVPQWLAQVLEEMRKSRETQNELTKAVIELLKEKRGSESPEKSPEKAAEPKEPTTDKDDKGEKDKKDKKDKDKDADKGEKGDDGNPPNDPGKKGEKEKPDPEKERVKNELEHVREALALEKSKTWRNSKIGRKVWRLAGGIFGGRTARSYENLKNLESRYYELNERMFVFEYGKKLEGLSDEDRAVLEAKYVFGEQDKLRGSTDEHMKTERRMRKIGSWMLKHKKWIIGGSAVLMPFTGGLSLGIAMGALTGAKADEKFSGMKGTITKVNQDEIRRHILAHRSNPANSFDGISYAGSGFNAGMKMSMKRFDEDINFESFKRCGAVALGFTACAGTFGVGNFFAAQFSSLNWDNLAPWLKAHTPAPTRLPDFSNF